VHPARLAALCLLAPASIYAASTVSGCGSDGGHAAGADSGGGESSSSSGGDSCSGPAPGGDAGCKEPPTPPQTSAEPTQTSHDYAISALYLGDTDRKGMPSADAWKSLGYDLDGKNTAATSTDVCALAPGASTQVQVDGYGAIDNSWGANILPIIVMAESTEPICNSTCCGPARWTEMMVVSGFDDSAHNRTTAVGLTGALLGGVTFLPCDVGLPMFDPSAIWPVDPATVSGCSGAGGCPAGTNPVTHALVKLPSAFQVDGLFASGAPVDLPVDLEFPDGSALPIDIKHAVVTFQPDRPGAVTNGTIAGVIPTQDLIATLRRIAGGISASLCTGSAFDSIAAQYEQTSDIVYDGQAISNPAGQPCNAISIGLGFDATEIAPPSVIGPGKPAPPDLCGD